MADYTGRTLSLTRYTGSVLQEVTGVAVSNTLWTGKIFKILPAPPAFVGDLRMRPRKHVINRGRNTGGGAAFMYWLSPDKADPTGLHYPYESTVPFAQLTDIIHAGIAYPNVPW